MDNGASSYRRFLDGDDEGIADIVREYKDGLILYLLTLCNNYNIAEELAEDTFFRLMIKKPHFSGHSSFKSWLYKIGRNIAIDHYRREKHLTKIPLEDVDNDIASEIDIAKAYLKEERRLLILDTLKKLNSDYRQVIHLVYFDELSPKEAGIIMKKNSRQMRNLLYRAKVSLKEDLKKEGFSYEEF